MSCATRSRTSSGFMRFRLTLRQQEDQDREQGRDDQQDAQQLS